MIDKRFFEVSLTTWTQRKIMRKVLGRRSRIAKHRSRGKHRYLY